MQRSADLVAAALFDLADGIVDRAQAVRHGGPEDLAAGVAHLGQFLGGKHVDDGPAHLTDVSGRGRLELSHASVGEHRRQAWYDGHTPTEPTADSVRLADELRALETGRSPAQFLATNGTGLKVPGLYSWWVDQPGADDLSRGLQHPPAAGLIYAGLAGATRWPSGSKSTNTL